MHESARSDGIGLDGHAMPCCHENSMEKEQNIRLEIAQIDNELESTRLKIEELFRKQEELSNRKGFLQKQLNQEEEESRRIDWSASNFDWSRSNFDWSQDVERVRKSVFDIDEFRRLQLDCINVTMSKIDCILIMPTGGGKSLCFQLPALISNGFTLVVSPLVSLMEDQLMALNEYKIKASLLNASSPKEHVNEVHGEMISGDSGLKVLYVTPEKIAKSKRFMAKLEKAYTGGFLSRIVIDEVHCASQWGHDFRPDYKILGILKRQFPNSPILGLTATATSGVIEDVKKILNLKPNCVILKASFNRPNLFYEVRRKPSKQDVIVDEIATVIKTQFAGQSGIVYCFSRKDSADVATALCKRSISAACYHADLTSESRTQVHHAWAKGSLKVIVATIAFGMGIDKANVRFVIHHTMSKSMENYYQESGRAGRDSKEAHCILYYSPTDASRQSCMVFTEQTGLEKLYKMLSYCQDACSCRRSLIAQHFGEEWNDAECNEMCDNCRNQTGGTSNPAPLKKDLTKQAQNVLKILQNAKSISERVTMIKLLEAWHCKGPKTLRVSGVEAPDLSPGDCQRFIVHLLLGGIISEDFHFTPYCTYSYLVPGFAADNVVADKSTVKMVVGNSDFCQKTSTVSRKTPNKRNRDKLCTNDRSSGKKLPKKGRKVEINISDDEIDGVTEQESSENIVAAKRRKLTEKLPPVSGKKSVVDIG